MCAAKFFLNRVIIDFFSQKKKRCKRMRSKIDWRFVTNKVIPNNIPNSIAKNTLRIIPKFIIKRERGSNM